MMLGARIEIDDPVNAGFSPFGLGQTTLRLPAAVRQTSALLPERN